MTPSILILPGIGSSGSEHWQTLWEASSPNMHRVIQADWDHPVCADWVATLEKAVAESGPQTLLVAHSLACLMVAHWTVSTRLTIRGAMLVAMPDPTGPDFPTEARGFAPLPEVPFSFPSLVVASTSDPYATLDYARHYASAWGSRFVNIGDAGHINASSNLGDWPEGRRLLDTL